MLEMLALALVLSVFAGTVHHLLAAQVGGASASAHGAFPASRLKRANPVETEDEAPGPAWASFPRAF